MRRLGGLIGLLKVMVVVSVAQTDTSAHSESLQIGLSTDKIFLTANFSGADLTIFGALDNANLLISRQNHYDVVVVLEGPARAAIVRRKDRVLGMWVNRASETFVSVPASYSMSTTRAKEKITAADTYRRLSLGADNIPLKPGNKEQSPATIGEFTRALRDLKKATGLYSERIGGVQFLSQTLFRATLPLAPDVPVGIHKARAFLFRDGLFIHETSTELVIQKSGFAQSIFDAAHNSGIWYGFFAVGLAIIAGWLGRLLFR